MNNENTSYYAGEMVATLHRAIRYGGGSLHTIPNLLKKVIREELWKTYLIGSNASGPVLEFKSFGEFIQKGLDTDARTLQNLCRDDVEALDLLDSATTNPVGVNQHTEGVDIINTLSEGRPDGTSKDYALRRLRKERPDIHQRVIAGEVTANAGMIEAGFRVKTFSVRRNTDSVVRALKTHFSEEERKRIRDLI